MPNFNQVTLIGHLTRDPEVRYVGQANTALCSCGIAVTDKFKSGNEWKEDTLFIDLNVWGKSGERFSEWFSKGQAVLVSGKLKLETWDDKNTGQKRSKHSLTVFDFANCSGRQEQAARPQSPQPAPPAIPDDEVPF